MGGVRNDGVKLWGGVRSDGGGVMGWSEESWGWSE